MYSLGPSFFCTCIFISLSSLLVQLPFQIFLLCISTKKTLRRHRPYTKTYLLCGFCQICCTDFLHFSLSIISNTLISIILFIFVLYLYNLSLAIDSLNTKTTIRALPSLHLIFPARTFVDKLVIRIVICGANGEVFGGARVETG